MSALTPLPTTQTPPDLTVGRLPKVSSGRKREANRENAQLSTGPTSDAGKAIAAVNNFRHGLTGAFCLLPNEDPAAFSQLQSDLSGEHNPATPTESLLVNDMARHYWLYQRALRLQESCFAADLTAGPVQNQLSLYLRYGVTHERAFRRCLADLLKLRKEKLRLERGFESQKREAAAERRREAMEVRRIAAEKRRDAAQKRWEEELDRRASAGQRASDQDRYTKYVAKMLRQSGDLGGCASKRR